MAIFGGLIAGAIARNLLTFGLSKATDVVARRIAKPHERADTEVAGLAKPAAESSTLGFADLLLAGGLWYQLAPLAIEALEKYQLLGEWSGLAVIVIGGFVKFYRYKTTQPAV